MTNDITIMVLTGVVFCLALSLVSTLVILRRLERRYERFRHEVGGMFEVFQARLDDQDIRLTAAGYAPGRAMQPSYGVPR